MKDKGFTLVELLAVIIILSVIALISAPIIFGIIESSQKDTLKITAQNIFKAIDSYLIEELIEIKQDLVIDVLDPSIINYKGKVDKGQLVVTPGDEKTILLVKDKFCVYGSFNDLTVTKTKDEEKCMYYGMIKKELTLFESSYTGEYITVEVPVNNTYIGKGGTQTAGGTNTSVDPGKFGIGGESLPRPGNDYHQGGAGGGGYYGGSGGKWHAGGGGGSSYISGHPGVNSISYASVPSNIIHTGEVNHYSGYAFTNTLMIDGNNIMPTFDSSSTMKGNINHGYMKITYITYE